MKVIFVVVHVYVCVCVDRERIAKQQIDYVGVAKRSKMKEEKRFYPFAALTEKEGRHLTCISINMFRSNRATLFLSCEFD